MVAALIIFDQGGPGTPGQAFEGTLGSLVTVTNDDNTDVTSWSIELLDVPSGSALSTGVLNAAATNTPTAGFTPDVPGSYRVSLTVNSGSSENKDIRNFGVRNARGIIVPPYQKLPDPLPLPGVTGTALDKPDELNFNGVSRGWAGTPNQGLLEAFIQTYDDLPSTTISSASYALGGSGPPLTVVDLDATGSSCLLTLPDNPRVNQVVRILALGTVPGRTVTVLAAGVGSVASYGSLSLPLNGYGTFVHTGANVWLPLGVKTDFYERTLVGGVESTQQTSFVDIGTTTLDLSNFVNIQKVTFQAVVETTSVLDPVEVRLYNVTTSTVVASSTIQSTSLVPASVSADVTGSFPAGLNVYVAQLRLTNTGSPERATCKQAQLVVDWVQV